MKVTRPEKWVMLQVRHNGEYIYRVIGGWTDSGEDKPNTGLNWALSFNIEEVGEGEHYVEFFSKSGESFVCAKNAYGTTKESAAILKVMAGDNHGHYDRNKIVLPADTDWTDVKWIN